MQQKQRTKTRLLTFFPESQQARQFTPLREGRRFAMQPKLSATLFQFTPLREGRPMVDGIHTEVIFISIHAPPRGATRVARLSCRALRHFNSRPSARGDVDDPENYQQMVISIHAPPRGATTAMHRARSSSLFQFTPLREGRRHFGGRAEGSRDISIHAPPRGATRGLREERRNAMISIHAPPRGATVHGVCWGYWNLISIHAPPRGATKLIDALKGEYGISIHAPPRGATA